MPLAAPPGPLWTADAKEPQAHEQLANELAEEFAGQTVSESQVCDFVLTKTPFYSFKRQVNKLRTANRATPRQLGQWPVTFATT